MITKEMKINTCKELKDSIDKAEGVFLTNLVGISSNDANDIRRKVRLAGGKVVVTRNTLFKKAAEGTDISSLAEDLRGPKAFAFAFKDSPAVAKVLYDAGKENETVTLEKGFLDGKELQSNELEALAKLPSKDQMLATLLATFNAPVSAFVRVMDAIKNKKNEESAE